MTYLASIVCLVFTVALVGCESDELFRSVPSEESGVQFVNAVTDSADFNILNYLYFYDGGGVAIGDVTGDDLPDLYFTANQGPNRLYVNQGGLRFKDETEQAGVAGTADWTTGVAMADVDGDELLDIYVSVVSGFAGRRGRNQLFMNQGDGTFVDRASEYDVDFAGYSTQAAFFDYDADGDLDLFLLNHSTHEEDTHQSSIIRYERHPLAGDRLFRNDGGRFTDVSEAAGMYGGATGYGLGVVTSDLNGDRCPDVYVANDFHEYDYLYWNNCDGTFTEGMQTAAGHNSRSSMGVDAADVDNDGRPDVVVLDMLPAREDILKTSASVEEHSIYRHKVDLGYHHQFTRNTLLLNRGEGRFSDIGMLAGIEATDWSWSALFADFDNDGWKDLFVTNGIWRRPNDEDYLASVSSPSMRRSLDVVSVEDLVVLDSMPHVRIANFAFRNVDGLRFENETENWGIDQPLFSNGAAYADLDNDGDLDLVVNNVNDPASVFENNGGKGHYLGVRLVGDDQNTLGIGARVFVTSRGQTQVQELLATRGFQSSVDPRLLFGFGDADTVDMLLAVWPDGRTQRITEIPTNQYVTIRQSEARNESHASDSLSSSRIFTTPASTADYRHVENLYNDLTHEPLIPHLISTEGPALASGDVNGDGLDDLFVGSAKWMASALLVQQQSGTFVRSPLYEDVFVADSLYEDVDASFFDADGDGDVDLYVVTAGNEWWGEHEALVDRLYINDGGRLRRSADALPPMFEHGSVVRPADFDGDGDTDLFVGGRVVAREYGRSPRSYLLRNDHGRFADVTESVAPPLREAGMITDALWIDIDADGALDLVAIGEWMSPQMYRQVDGRLEAHDGGFAGLEGWWTALATTDLNGDARPDLILGNLGLNSRLRARDDQPVRLYIGDLDADSEDERIMTSFRNGVSYPWANRQELLTAFPSLARKYPSYASYGASTIDDIFPAPRVRDSKLLEARTFESVVAINRGDGTFDVKPLPDRAQISPIRALLAGDFDSDGYVDVIAGGNFSGVTPARGRYDASYGTFLRGDGHGNFIAVEPSVSGLWLEGEVRKLRIARTKAGAVIVAARNGRDLQFVASNKVPR